MSEAGRFPSEKVRSTFELTRGDAIRVEDAFDVAKVLGEADRVLDRRHAPKRGRALRGLVEDHVLHVCVFGTRRRQVEVSQEALSAALVVDVYRSVESGKGGLEALTLGD